MLALLIVGVALMAPTAAAQTPGPGDVDSLVEQSPCDDGSPGLYVGGDSQPLTCVREPIPEVNFLASASDVLGNEVGGDLIKFIVQRSISSKATSTEATGDRALEAPLEAPLDLTVRFQVSGNATPGVDYSVLPLVTAGVGTLVIPSGKSTNEIVIGPRFDLDRESDEEFALTILPGEGYRVGTTAPSLKATIAEYEHNSVVLDGPAAAVTGEGRPAAAFDLVRSGALTHALLVQIGIGGTATRGADYNLLVDGQPFSTPAASIPAGKQNVTLTVVPLQDGAPEVQETVSLWIAAPAGDATPSTHYDHSTDIVTIPFEDDELPLVSIEAVDAVAAEAGAGSATPDVGRFRIQRTGASLGPLSVNFATSGQATHFADYDLRIGTSFVQGDRIEFATGQDHVNVTVLPLQDTDREGSQLVILSVLPQAAKYNVAANAHNATVTIFDDDVPLVTLAAVDSSIHERGDTKAVLALTRSAIGLDQSLLVNLTYSGTAERNRDFTGPANATFAPNATTAFVELVGLNDTVSDDNETIVVALQQSASVAYGVGVPPSTTLRLRDIVPNLDHDGDGKPDAIDNCPSVANADQLNTDGAADGGDACDTDDDNDGLSDERELQLGTSPIKQDTDGDSRSDAQEVHDMTDPKDRLSPGYAPSGVDWASDGDGVQVTWAAPLGSRVNRYLVFREATSTTEAGSSTTSATSPVFVGEVPGAGNKATYLFEDRAFPGGSHRYHVQPMLPADLGQAFNRTSAVASTTRTMEICTAFTLDSDGDGLCDQAETALGTRIDRADSDGDGLMDADEVKAGLNPLSSDARRARGFSSGDLVVLGTGGVLAWFCLAMVGYMIGQRRRRR